MSLLDRTSSHDDAPDDEKDIMANEYLASFKVRLRSLIKRFSRDCQKYMKLCNCVYLWPQKPCSSFDQCHAKSNQLGVACTHFPTYCVRYT